MADSEAVTQAEVDAELHDCARHGAMDDLRMMCEGDDTGPMVNYNVTDATGSSALHKAAANGHVDIMKYLVEHGAVFIENQAGAGPLTWAVLNKQVEAVKYLLATFSAQIDVLKKPEAGMSPLSTAYDSDCQEVISLLLAHDSAKALDSMPQEDTDERAEDLPETDAADAEEAEDAAAEEAAAAADEGADAAAADDEALAKEVDDKLKL